MSSEDGQAFVAVKLTWKHSSNVGDPSSLGFVAFAKVLRKFLKKMSRYGGKFLSIGFIMSLKTTTRVLLTIGASDPKLLTVLASCCSLACKPHLS